MSGMRPLERLKVEGFECSEVPHPPLYRELCSNRLKRKGVAAIPACWEKAGRDGNELAPAPPVFL